MGGTSSDAVKQVNELRGVEDKSEKLIGVARGARGGAAACPAEVTNQERLAEGEGWGDRGQRRDWGEVRVRGWWSAVGVLELAKGCGRTGG